MAAFGGDDGAAGRVVDGLRGSSRAQGRTMELEDFVRQGSAMGGNGRTPAAARENSEKFREPYESVDFAHVSPILTANGRQEVMNFLMDFFVRKTFQVDVARNRKTVVVRLSNRVRMTIRKLYCRLVRKLKKFVTKGPVLWGKGKVMHMERGKIHEIKSLELSEDSSVQDLSRFLMGLLINKKLYGMTLPNCLRKAFRRLVRKLHEMGIVAVRKIPRPRKKDPAVQHPDTRADVLKVASDLAEIVGKHIRCLLDAINLTKDSKLSSFLDDFYQCVSTDSSDGLSASTKKYNLDTPGTSGGPLLPVCMRSDDGRLPLSVAINEVDYPERPGEPECRYYMKFGECKHMSSCSYHHPKHRHLGAKSHNLCQQEKMVSDILPQGCLINEVFVRVCGHNVVMHPDFNTTTVKELVLAALKK